jgi:TadE-like protein
MNPSRRRGRQGGQALVEFSFGILVFLALFVGMIDLARAVFTFNGVAQAAREIARETSVHPGDGTLGDSSESLAAVAVQEGLVPGLQSPVFECFDIEGVLQLDSCQPADWVRVTASADFTPSLPVLTLLGTLTVSSTSSAEIQ